MATENRTQDSKKNAATVEVAVEPGNTFQPVVDIVENGDDLTLYFDLPGVPLGSAEVEVDENNILTLRAKNAFKEPDGEVFRQAAIGDYYRAYQLDSEYDSDRRSVQHKDGVLVIRIPKR